MATGVVDTCEGCGRKIRVNDASYRWGDGVITCERCSAGLRWLGFEVVTAQAPKTKRAKTLKASGKKVIGKGRGPWHSGGNMVLSEITKEIQSEWADAYNPSGFRHGVSEAPIYLYRELANGLVSVLARALKAEYRLEHVYCSEDIHWDGNTDKAHAKWHNTDADWIAEAERILRKNR